MRKKDEIRVVGKKIPLRPTLEENFRITPKFWADCAKDGTIARLADMMDTPIYGLMGVSPAMKRMNGSICSLCFLTFAIGHPELPS